MLIHIIQFFPKNLNFLTSFAVPASIMLVQTDDVITT